MTQYSMHGQRGARGQRDVEILYLRVHRRRGMSEENDTVLNAQEKRHERTERYRDSLFESAQEERREKRYRDSLSESAQAERQKKAERCGDSLSERDTGRRRERLPDTVFGTRQDARVTDWPLTQSPHTSGTPYRHHGDTAEATLQGGPGL